MPEYRVLTQDDIQEMTRIWQSLDHHYDHPVGGDWTPHKLQLELDKSNSIGAFSDEGALEAFCLFRAADDIKEITLLVTDQRVHRTGAMRSLIRTLISEMQPQEKIWLEVHAGNLPAIGLYESLGFRLCGERLKYYRDGAKALLYEYSV